MPNRPPMALSAVRVAISHLYLDLGHNLRALRFANYTDADIETLMAVYAAVFQRHGENSVTTQSRIASHVGLPRITVMRKLDKLVELGLIVRIGFNYYVEPFRAMNATVADRRRYAKTLAKAGVELEPFVSEEMGKLNKFKMSKFKMNGRSLENPVRDAVPSAFVHDDPLYKRARIAYIRLYIETWKLHKGRLFEKAPEKGSEAAGCIIVAQCVILGDLEGKPMNASKIAQYLELPLTTVRNKLKLLAELGVAEKRSDCYVVTDQYRTMPRARAMQYKKIFMTALAECLPATRAAGDIV